MWVLGIYILITEKLKSIFQISKSKFVYPLTTVRPDYVPFASRDIPKSLIPQSPPLPYSRRTPPHFMAVDNPEKYLTKGLCALFTAFNCYIFFYSMFSHDTRNNFAVFRAHIDQALSYFHCNLYYLNCFIEKRGKRNSVSH